MSVPCRRHWPALVAACISGTIAVRASTLPSPSTPAERAADVVNVKDFGAKGDGATDDTAALNAAINYVRTHRTIGNGQPGITGQAYTAEVIIPEGRYKVTSSLNWTNLVSLTVEIDCQGCLIDGRTNGTPVIDALGSRWLRVNGLTIWGSDTATPSIGIQIGRTTDRSADDHHFEDLTLAGNFSFAALYDFAAETTAFDHLLVWNQSPSGAAFGIVLDGINHWHATSAFTTVTAAVDRPQSFNEALFINPSIMTASSAGAPIWMANTRRARFLTGYAANTHAGCGTVLYATGAWPIAQLTMDVHYENRALQDVLLHRWSRWHEASGHPRPALHRPISGGGKRVVQGECQRGRRHDARRRDPHRQLLCAQSQSLR